MGGMGGMEGMEGMERMGGRAGSGVLHVWDLEGGFSLVASAKLASRDSDCKPQKRSA